MFSLMFNEYAPSIHRVNKKSSLKCGHFLTPLYVFMLPLYNEVMDSLYDLLADRNFDEPPEVAAIKTYVREHYKAAVTVTVRDKDILVQVPGAPLASRLRFDLPKLRDAAKTDKRIVLRVGQA